jgi:hypothetical protein
MPLDSIHRKPAHPALLRLLATLLVAATMLGTSAAQERVQQTVLPLPDLLDGYASFQDADGDGDLELLLTGGQGSSFTRLYVYADTTFRPDDPGPLIRTKYYRPSLQAFRAVRQSDGAWGDLNGDGLPDLVLSGLAGGPVTDVYLNRTVTTNSPSFLRLNNTGLPAVYDGAVALASAPAGERAPYLVVCGAQSRGEDAQPVAEVYEVGGSGSSVSFTPLGLGIPPLTFCDAEWADYDGDGESDFAILGNASGSFYTAVYRGLGGGRFEAITAQLLPLAFGSVDWGDYDGDGDLDLLSSGGVLDPYVLRGVTRLYRNDGGTFTDVGVDLPGVVGGEARFLRYDADAFADVAITGEVRTLGEAAFGLYRGDGSGGFAQVPVPGELGAPNLAGFYRAALGIGDYNQDGDDDIVLLGVAESARVPTSGGGFQTVFDVPRTYFIKNTTAFDETTPGEYPEWRPPSTGGGGN